ncbi:MAG: cytidine deaminase [Eubacteriales bacterium]|nr:cytidine deaminase [Eubacteriales bacterium]
MTQDNLIEQARSVRRNAYAPYSGFHVGACLLAASGRAYAGCNVEAASYPAGCCAERAALTAAVSAGEREFTAIAIASDADGATWPCGVCRQALAEFGDMTVLATGREGTPIEKTTLAQLLPHAFEKEAMKHE